MPSSIISAAIKSNELYEDFCKQDFIFIDPTEVITVKSQKKPNSGAT